MVLTQLASLRGGDLGATAQELLDGIGRVCYDIARGLFTNTAAHDPLTELRGVALRKERDSDDPRPIGIGQMFATLAKALLVRAARPKLEEAIGPTNLCTRTGGAEGLATAVRAYLSAHPDHAVVQVDCQNAYNTPYRHEVKSLIADAELAIVAPALHMLYSTPTPVVYEDRRRRVKVTIKSTRGVAQGCPLSSATYCIIQRKAVEATLAAHPTCKMIGFADDVDILGPLDDALEASTTYRTQLARLGIKMQPGKSAVYMPSAAGSHAIAPRCSTYGIPAKDGIIVAGTPIGTPAFIAEALEAKLTEITTHLDNVVAAWQRSKDRLPGKNTLQKFVLLIRWCIAPASIMFLCRTVPPATMEHYAARFDHHLYKAMLTIADREGIPTYAATAALGAASKRAMHLRVREGGLGLASAVDFCRPAFVSCQALTAKYALVVLGSDFTPALHGATALPELHAIVESGYLTDPPKGLEDLNATTAFEDRGAEAKTFQRKLHERDTKGDRDRLLGMLDPQGKAQLRSRGGGGLAFLTVTGGNPLHAIPNQPMAILLRSILMLRQMPSGFPCPLCPRRDGVEPPIITPSGSHAHACPALQSTRTDRHHGLKRGIHETTRFENSRREGSPAVLPKNEPEIVLHTAWTLKLNVPHPPRVGDTKLTFPLSQLLDFKILDYVITFAGIERYPTADAEDGAAAKSAHDEKKRKYENAYAITPKDSFAPFAAEADGRLHEPARNLLRLIAEVTVRGDVKNSDADPPWTAKEKADYARSVRSLIVTSSTAIAIGSAVALHRLTVACEAQHRRHLSAAAQAAPTLPASAGAAAGHSQAGAGDDDTT